MYKRQKAILVRMVYRGMRMHHLPVRLRRFTSKLPDWAWATGMVVIMFAGFLFIHITGVRAATMTMLPVSDVQTGWTPSTGTTHYTLVDEGTTPNTTDYVSTGIGGSSVLTDEYGLQSVSNVASASQIVVSVYAQSATNANGGTLDTLNINLSVSGALQTAQTCTPVYNTWAWCTATFTGSWTQANVSAMHVVISNTINGSGKASGKEDNIQVADVYGTLTYVSSSQAAQNSYRLFSNADAGASPGTAFTAASGSPISTGTSPLEDNLTDVNGDGCPDLIVGSQGTNAVSVYINKCDGTNTFNSPATYAANGNPNTITTGDVNGDGCPDIVAANNYNGSNPSVFTVSVYINKCDGSGTFNAQAIYPEGNNLNYPNSVAIADVNGDGHPDILVVNNGPVTTPNTFTELLNNGDGTFPADSSLDATFGVGYYPRWIAAADLNGDGCPDAIVTNTDDTSSGGTDVDNTVSVLLNKCNGTGQFNPQVKYAAGTYPQFVTAKDLNGDGCPDIVAVNANSNNISVFLNNCDGTGTFPATGVTYSTGTGSNPWYAAIADFNGDGKLDIATADRGASANNVAILLGNGDGTFPTTGPSATYAVGTSPRAVAAASLNGGTGKADLAVTSFTNSTVSVLLNTSSMDVGSPLAAQDTAATTPGDGQTFRVRMDLGITNGTLGANSGSFKLQYAPMSGSCDATTTGYSNVTNTSTVQYYNNPNGLNGAPLTPNANDPTDSLNPPNPLVYETYQQQGTTTFTNPFSIPAGSDGVWDFALTTYHTLVGQHYCLRIVNGDSSTLSSYATGATAEIIMPPSTIAQAGYRWFQNNDQAPSVYPVSEDISTSSDVASATAIDPAGGYMYVVGSDAASGSTEWRIEKRSLSTGALVSGFGTNGAISENISTGGDTANAIAIDPAGGYMYVVGSDDSLALYTEWRIEKRSLSTGALVSGFGTNGAISENISSGGDVANAIAIDPSGGYMYVVGSADSAYDAEWRIEKRSLSTGALVSGFGTSGAISEDISTSSDVASATAIDPAGGYMYVVGYDSIPSTSNYEWRIEKRSLSTGALVSGFGTSGAISEDISTGADIAYVIAIDPAGGYMYVVGSDAASGSTEWRIEKRSLSTGALVSGFGTSGAISEDISTRTDTANAIAIDPSGGYMYVVGYDSIPSTSNYEWRIEKRSLSTGALVSGFGTNGAISENISTGGDTANAIAIDPAGGYMYVVGSDATPGASNYEWRIEARGLSMGDVAVLSATPLMPQNKTADITGVDGSNNQPFRLRLLMQIGASGADIGALSLKLQYAPISGGSCSATSSANFADVSTSTAIHFYTGNANITDGMALTPYANDPADGTNPIVYQTYKDINPFTNGQGIIYAGQDGLWDFPLQFAPNASHTTWCLRVVQSSTGAAINAYSVYPQINSAATMKQLMRGGEWWNSAGVRQPINLGQ